MSRFSFTRASVISSLTLALIVAACSSDDSKNNSSGNNAGNTTTGTTSNTAAGPTTSGTTVGTTGAANNSAGPTNGTVGNPTAATTMGTSGGEDTTSETSAGGTSAGGATGTQGTTGSGGGSAEVDCSPAEGEIPPLTLTEVASGINVPVDLAHPPGDDRLFVATLDGDVRIIKDGQVVATPFLSLGNRVVVGGARGDERGLLGIAFHPNYADNGLFYLHYSAGEGIDDAGTSDTVIEEYEVSSDPDVADPASARVVLIVDQPSGQNNHKGGSITFGPEGLLYIGLGDGGGGGDTMGNGQNTSVLLGKILRIDPVESDGEPYSTPADNLVQDVPAAAPEIWDYGVRNPFRFSFDVCDGDLYIGDVGQNFWEEITIEKAGEGRKNYGWNVVEGLHCFDGNDTCEEGGCGCDDTSLPMVELERTQATSITGGAVYRGSSIPALRGAYFYADYATNNAWYTRYDRDAHSIATPTSVTQDLNVKSIVAIKNGNDGELYFVSLMLDGEISATNHGEGAIYKLTAAE